VADSLNNIALVLQKRGRYDEAQPLYERALRIRVEKLGPEHAKVARVRYNMACLAALRGDRETALNQLRTAVEGGFLEESMLDDPDLASLRGDSEFEAILDGVRERLSQP
jgi:tetratricopeptide (TPR) repeat protein